MSRDVREQLRRYRSHFEAGLADFDLEDVVTGGAEAPRSPRFSRPPRSWLVVVAAALTTVLAVGLPAYLLLKTDQAGVEADPAAPSASPATTTTSTATTTTLADPTTIAAGLTADPASISWRRIDSPGAFDIHRGLIDSQHDDLPVPGQLIEAIIAVPACDEQACDGVAGYVAAGRVDIWERTWDAGVWVSADGEQWTAVDGPGFSGDGGRRILALATNGRRIVAAGMLSMGVVQGRTEDRALVWYSDDLGHSWTEIEDPSFETGHGGMMDVVWTGEGFIGVGNGFWFSPDGISWTLTVDEEPPVLVRSLARWDGRWAAVGDGRETSAASVWESTDGRTWDLVYTDVGVGEDPIAGALAVAPGRTGIVAVGFKGSVRWDRVPAAWRSEVGTPWHSLPSIPWDGTTLWLYEAVDDLVRVGDWLYAVGNSWNRWGTGQPFVLASDDDGATWTRVSLDSEVFATSFSAAGLFSPSDFPRSDGGFAGLAGIEVMPFPADSAEPSIILVGSNGTNAAIWVGTLRG